MNIVKYDVNRYLQFTTALILYRSLHAEALQSTASEGLAQDPYFAAIYVEWNSILRHRTTTKPTCPTIYVLIYTYKYIHRPTFACMWYFCELKPFLRYCPCMHLENEMIQNTTRNNPVKLITMIRFHRFACNQEINFSMIISINVA